MSQRLYVFFQPFGCDYNDIHQQARMIDEAVPGAVERKSRGSIDIAGPWAGYLECDYLFPYLCFCFFAYWSDVLNGTRFRKYVRSLCEALGVHEWWYIEETSLDIFYEMTPAKFDKALSESPTIEEFQMSTYFPNGEYHAFKDTIEAVEAVE